MEYGLLFGAILCFSLQSLCMKQYDIQPAGNEKAALWAPCLYGLFRGGLCLLANRLRFSITWNSAVCGIWYAALTVICYVSFLAALRQGKVAVVTVFMLLGGMILPALYGVIGLGERVSGKGWIAIGVMLCAMLPSRDAAGKTRHRAGFWILCVLIFLSNGLISVVTKYHQVMAGASSENEFLIFSSGMTCLFSAMTLWIPRRRARGGALDSLRGIPLAAMGMLLGYALLNAGGNLFSLRAARNLPSSVQFPVLSAGVIVLTAVASAVVFREPITRTEGRQIGFAIAGIVLFMI